MFNAFKYIAVKCWQSSVLCISMYINAKYSEVKKTALRHNYIIVLTMICAVQSKQIIFTSTKYNSFKSAVKHIALQ